MNRIECAEVFARLRGQAIVIVSPGYTGHELAAANHDDATIYNMDMPYSSPMCLGLALACPEERVVALEGDGSMLMAMGTLATIARYKPENLTVITFQNGVYLTTGDGTVPTAQADFSGIARACGIHQSVTVSELDQFSMEVKRSLCEPGPWFICAEVDASDRGDSRASAPFPGDLVEQAVLFQKAMRERGHTTFGGHG